MQFSFIENKDFNYFYDVYPSIHELNKVNTNKSVVIENIIESTAFEYIDRIISFNLTFEKPRTGLLYGFLKNTEYINNSDYFNRIDLVPKYPDKSFIDLLNNFHGKIAIYKDAYATSFGEFVIGNTVIRPPYDSGPQWIRMFCNGSVVLECDKACVFGHGNMGNFGHFINDYLCPLVLLPNDYLRDCVVVLSHRCGSYAREFLECLDVRQYFFVGFDEWVFAKRLAVCIEGRPHNMHFGVPVQNLHDKLTNHFKLFNIVPSQYVILNRAHNTDRSLENFDELTDMIKLKFPTVKFLFLYDQTGSILSYARFFSTIKFLFTTSGSNCHKCIFMRLRTVFVCCSIIMMDFAAWETILSCDIALVVFNHRVVPLTGPFSCDIDISIRAIKSGIVKLVICYYSISLYNFLYHDIILCNSIGWKAVHFLKAYRTTSIIQKPMGFGPNTVKNSYLDRLEKTYG